MNRLALNRRSGLHRAAPLWRRLLAGLAALALISLWFVVVGELPAGATTTYEVTTTIPVGDQPDAEAIDVNTGLVYVPNSVSNSVSVISEATNAVVATIAVGTNPNRGGG